MNEKIINALRSIELLAGLPDPALDRLVQFSMLRKIRAGETIFCQGEPSPYCFGIVSGQVTIQRISREQGFPPKVLSVLSAGALFGEQGLFKDNPRTAMAVARQDGELVAIQGRQLRDWLEKDKAAGVPFLLEILQGTMTRLGQTSHELSLVYGVGRCLIGNTPVEEAIWKTMEFLRASLEAADEVRLYRRNPYWDEFDPFIVTPAGANGTPALPLSHAVVQRLIEKPSPVILEQAQEMENNAAVALLPLIDTENAAVPLLGFLWIASRSNRPAFSAKILLLLEAVGLQITDALLRLQRQDDKEAQSRLQRNRQSFSL